MQAALTAHTDANAGSRRAAPERDLPRRLLHGYLHKTSNCLCGIKGYASMIAAGSERDITTGAWAQRILAEVEQMERIYRSIQEIAFPLRQAPRGDDLALVIRKAIADSRQRHPNLTVRSDLTATGPLLLPARDLELVLGELLANSAESGGRDDWQVRVSLATTAARDRVKLTVRDDGCGLPAELLRDATAPFVTTKDGHLGIGLARVDTVMDMYGLPWSIQSDEFRGTCIELLVASSRDGGAGAEPHSREG